MAGQGMDSDAFESRFFQALDRLQIDARAVKVGQTELRTAGVADISMKLNGVDGVYAGECGALLKCFEESASELQLAESLKPFLVPNIDSL